MADLDKPLLGDVEQGPGSAIPQEPSKEEAAALAKEGEMSWAALIAFFTDRTHWVVTALVAYTLLGGMGLMFFFIRLQNFDLDHKIGIVAFCCLVGLGGGAYSSFLAERLKEEYNRNWRLNEKLKSEKARLQGTCRGVRLNVEKMHTEVDKFRQLKDLMSAYEQQVGSGFGEAMGRAQKVLDRMQDQLIASMSDTLSSYAQSFEHGKFGLTRENFEKFKERLPPRFKSGGEFDVTFETVAKGNDTAAFKDVQALIDEATKSRRNEASAGSSTD